MAGGHARNARRRGHGRGLATGLAIASLLLAGCSDDVPVASAGDTSPSSAETGSTTTGTTAGATTTTGDAMGVEDRDDALWLYPPTEGAELTYASSGIGGEDTYTVTVTGVTESGAGTAVAVSQAIHEAVVIQEVLTTTAGGLSMDPTAFSATAEGVTVVGSGEPMVVPPISELEGGDTLSGQTYTEMRSDDFEMRNDISWSTRGLGFQQVTVPAGTFDVYVIEIALDIDSSLAGQLEGTTTLWLEPGFALIRSETVMGSSGSIIAELVSHTG